jgi:hypothetical protein
VFKAGNWGKEQMPVKYQIMIWLHFFGHEGMTRPMQGETLHTCTGLCKLACDRVTKEFNYIRDEWIYWPDVEERKAIARQIEMEYFLPNCVGLTDGTCSSWRRNHGASIKLITTEGNMHTV